MSEAMKKKLLPGQPGHTAVLDVRQPLPKKENSSVKKVGWAPPYSDYREIPRWDRRPVFRNAVGNVAAANKIKFRTRVQTPYTTKTHLDYFPPKEQLRPWPQFGALS